MRTTPDRITELKPDEIFVFGSNLAGRHGKGAAKTAMKWGAKYGEGFGLQGSTFAIPTKDWELRPLRLWDIKNYVTTFYLIAFHSPDSKYLVTEIGCGLAGYRPEQIAPFFEEAAQLDNVYLPKRFWEIYD